MYTYKNRVCIDWKNSIGHTVRFIYNEIEGFIVIEDYDSLNRMLSLAYLTNTGFLMSPIHFKEGKIKNLINGIQKKETYRTIIQHKYEVGDVINGLLILEKVRIIKSENISEKGYRYECTKDGYVDEMFEGNLKRGYGCPVCSSHRVMKGVNDIATTREDLVKYFVNREDAYTHTYASNKKVMVQCPTCEKQKEMAINKLSGKAFSCPRCSDGASYPEKFILNVLEQLKLEFSTQLNNSTLTWCDKYRYDFYIPSLNCIIETHGLQHYENAKGNWKTLECELENDAYKEKLAKDNGIKKYIILNCSKSETNLIKSSVMYSDLPKLLNFIESDIDWLRCHEFALSSRVKEACDLWNNGIKNTVEIGVIMKLSRNTISSFLKNGKILGWCDYDSKEIMRLSGINMGNKGKGVPNLSASKKVRVVETGEEFISCVDLMKKSEEKFGTKFNANNISMCCRKERKSYKGYHFEYI